MSFMKYFEHLKIQMKDVALATNNFDPTKVIGSGGFGKVYKGELSSPDGPNTVAFKHLDRRLGQGNIEFWKEIVMLTQYKHENLISLYAFCIEGDEMILVYEYACRGSLDRYLIDATTLSWIQRLKICVGAARGLHFLHDPKKTHQRVLHRDIKSANILLDENWNAKVSDFGLSKVGPANQAHTYLVSHGVGTLGYCDPLYWEWGYLTKESDVYSFGVVLFEILCGRLCYEYHNRELTKILVPKWRQCYEENRLDEIILLGLKEQMDQGSLKSFSAIAYQCVKKVREERPTMAEIVKQLEFSLKQQEILELYRKREDFVEHLNANMGSDSDLIGGLAPSEASNKNWQRPPLLAPPPVMSRMIVDDISSNWDLIKSFAPNSDKDLASDNVIMTVETSGIKTSTINTSVSSSGSDASRDGFLNWQVGDFLGSGSLGTVYEGFSESGLFFAVKEVSLLALGRQGNQSILQLVHEISLLSQFRHENIVQYLGTAKDDGKLYIFLELVTKGSLAKLYQKYELRDPQVAAYTRQILSGLNYLHEQNVVHRDIKCANILVDRSGSVKLADFGLAKATTFMNIRSFKGTSYWMAPEVVDNRNFATDIWSLGCTVLEMFTRKNPYSDLEGMQALFRIGMGEAPPIPDTLTKEARDFILECLQVNPDDRPTAAQLLEHPFIRRRTFINSALASMDLNA